MDSPEPQRRSALAAPVAFARSRAVWIGVILAVLLATALIERGRWHGLFNAEGPGSGHGVNAKNVGHALPNPFALFNQRSPGERGAGALLQTKNRLALVTGKPGRPGAGKPHERVLANIRYPQPNLITPLLPNDNLCCGPPPFDVVPPGITPPPVITPPSIFPPVIPPVPQPVIGGGQPPPVVVTVPEPETWVTLILGMFLIGAGVRSRQRRRSLPPVSGDGLTSAAGSSHRGKL